MINDDEAPVYWRPEGGVLPATPEERRAYTVGYNAALLIVYIELMAIFPPDDDGDPKGRYQEPCLFCHQIAHKQDCLWVIAAKYVGLPVRA